MFRWREAKPAGRANRWLPLLIFGAIQLASKLSLVSPRTATGLDALLEQTPNAPDGQSAVWKNAIEFSKGAGLSRGVDLGRYVACMVATGTRASIEEDKASGLWNVQVLEGPTRGCRGVVEGRFLYLVNREPAPVVVKPPPAKSAQPPRQRRPGELTEAEQQQAIRFCQERVLSQLKAPGTAHFVTGFYSEGKRLVVGEVDAQNSYGALLRGTYGCDMDGVISKNADIFTRK